MSDLLVTGHTPILGTGRAMRVFGVMAALARSGPLEVAYVPFDGPEPDPAVAAIPGITLRPIGTSRGAHRALAYARARLSGVPDGLARAVSPELAHSADGHTGRVIADGPAVAAALISVARRHPRTVYLAHNLESGFRHTPALERLERRILQTYGESWMATRADVDGGAALAGPGAALRYVPNVVDVSRIPLKGARPGTEQVLMVADFTYEPNRDGLAFLAGEVMPLVWERLPGARVLAVGRGLTDPPRDERISTPGFVDDLDAAYAGAGAVAVPLRHGGGSPLKFVEALAHGVPVVATDHAARLLDEGTPGQEFLAAATPEAFAAALVEVLSGSRDALGPAGRALAERAYSVETLAGLLAAA